MIQDYGFRLYNPAIGKFLSVDPLAPEYPWYTPYQFAGNMPINAVDLDGLEPKMKHILDASQKQVPLIERVTSKGTFVRAASGYSTPSNRFSMSEQINHALGGGYQGPRPRWQGSTQGDYIGWFKSKNPDMTLGVMGIRFEQAVLRAMGSRGNNSFKVGSQYPRTIPDDIGMTMKLNSEGTVTHAFARGHLTEIKMNKYIHYLTNRRSHKAPQFPNMLEDLSESTDMSAMNYGTTALPLWVDGANITAADVSIGILTIITPQGAWIDKKIVDEATRLNVQLYQREVFKDIHDNITVGNNIPLNNVRPNATTGYSEGTNMVSGVDQLDPKQ